MLYISRSVVRVFLGLLLLFTIHRLFFIVFFFSSCSQYGIPLLLRAFLEAVPLDVSTATYISVISFFLIVLQYVFEKKLFCRLNQIYLAIMISLTTLIAVADMIVYREMNVKIHFLLLYHLQHPGEVFNSAPTSVFLIGFPFIFVFSFLYCRLFFKYLVFTQPDKSRLVTRVGLSLPAMSAIIFLFAGGVRGGFRPIPINESEVYFTKHQVLNDAAVNPSWTLIHSYLDNMEAGKTNPYHFMAPEKASRLVREMYATADSMYGKFLTTSRPNLAFIILESWAGDVVSSCGGDPGITPNFDSLAKGGMLFSNFYASGQLSHLGITAILSGYPASPLVAVITNINKYSRVPCINRELEKHGYNSSFYYGGQLIYGNIKSYLYYNGFDEIKERTDFPEASADADKLGIHDEKMFGNWLDALDTKKQPFFSCFFTLSTHSPYGRPVHERLHQGGSERKYVNSVFYSDSCLGDFFRKAQTKPWYKNTLFVLVADHSNHSPRNRANSSPEHNHIPLLLFGEPIKKDFRGKVFTHAASQTDIAGTVLGQLNIPHESYRWSRNLLDSAHAFAFYSFYHGYGLVTPKGSLVWDKMAGGIYTNNTFKSVDSLQYKAKGEAYLQELFREYLDF